MKHVIKNRSGSGVFCDRCRSSYALAVIDGAKLCRTCIDSTTLGRDKNWIIEHTAPLELKAPVKMPPGTPGKKGSNQVA